MPGSRGGASTEFRTHALGWDEGLVPERDIYKVPQDCYPFNQK